MRKRPIWFAALLLATVAALGCEPAISLTVRNPLGFDVSVSLIQISPAVQDELGIVPMGESRTWLTRIAGRAGFASKVHRIVAKDSRGNIVFSQDYTWDELDKMKWTIVMTEQRPP